MFFCKAAKCGRSVFRAYHTHRCVRKTLFVVTFVPLFACVIDKMNMGIERWVFRALHCGCMWERD